MRKIRVDKSLCIGCGTCVALASRSFKIEDNGKSTVLNPAGDDEEVIRNAIDSCPVEAIGWEE